MALDEQIHIYSIDTSAFYTKEEECVFREIVELNKKKKVGEKVNKEICKLKDNLYKLFKENEDIRKLNPKSLNDYNVISVFKSTLTRVLGIKTDELSEDIIIVQTYYFDIIKDLILNGFMHNNEKYIYFTSSAGQIRTKKCLFIREEVFEKYKNTLMCGLTIEDFNKAGGICINKYLSYLALCNSASDEWVDFDIDKSIVVDDLKTSVTGEVDFIDDETYEIERKIMSISIEHTDGCGMILPRVKNKNMVVRLPWLKGLLTPFSFDGFIKKNKGNSKIRDIYGKEYDIFDDNIEIIFTKSQFKAWKYYKDWQSYKDNFKKHKCQAGICSQDEDNPKDKELGYQMLQTLTDISEKELKDVAKRTNDVILNLTSDKKTMLDVFGAGKNKTYLQQALTLYPELLTDIYLKKILRDIKRSKVKNARAGKLLVDAKYAFIIPDMYAFCEYLFLDDKNPKGLLNNGEVYCNIYKSKNKLCCLRSPHLYREWAVRNNITDEKKDEWFITNGLYISTHDLITKIIMCDCDGDTSLVVSNENLVNIANRNMKDIVPLYYEMASANVNEINNANIYEGLKLAFSGANIGDVSNNITKIWNSDNVDLDVIRLLVMEGNFLIDYAKTLYKPIRPKEIKKKISEYTKKKVPHFFIYAKDYSKNRVEDINNSVINKLKKIIHNRNLRFDFLDEEFDYETLMYNKDISTEEYLAKKIIEKYEELDNKVYFLINRKRVHSEENNIPYTYSQIKNQMLNVCFNKSYIVDVLVKYLYGVKNSRYKETLWQCFGDVIVDNIKRNIGIKISNGYIHCSECNKLILPTNNRHTYCHTCWKNHRNNYQKELMRRIRS